MKPLHISRAGQIIGTFNDEEVKEGLTSGRFFPSDYAWRQGMEEWQRLENFAASLGGDVSRSVSVEVSSSGDEDSPAADEESRADGLPWENRERMSPFAAYLETFKLVLFQPRQAFSRMRTKGGYKDPILFALPGTFIFGIFASLGLFAILPRLLSMAGATNVTMMPDRSLIRILVETLIGVLFWVPVTFLRAGSLHLCLKLLRGAKQPMEATFRVLAYAEGSLCVLQVVPICGSIAFVFQCFVHKVIGLSSVHGISRKRAFLACILPSLAACFCMSSCVGALFLNSDIKSGFEKAFKQGIENAKRSNPVAR